MCAENDTGILVSTSIPELITFLNSSGCMRQTLSYDL